VADEAKEDCERTEQPSGDPIQGHNSSWSFEDESVRFDPTPALVVAP
jgi:hypothetical protein